MEISLDAIRLKKITLRAEGYLELGMPSRTLDEVRRANELRLSFTPQLLYLEGAALFETKKYRDALYPLGQAVLMEPSDIKLWLLIGMCQKRVGRCDLAIESLENALFIQPKSTVVLYNLACYHALAKQTEKCLKYLSRCLYLDPTFRDFVNREPDFNLVRNRKDFLQMMDECDRKLGKNDSISK